VNQEIHGSEGWKIGIIKRFGESFRGGAASQHVETVASRTTERNDYQRLYNPLHKWDSNGRSTNRIIDEQPIHRNLRLMIDTIVSRAGMRRWQASRAAGKSLIVWDHISIDPHFCTPFLSINAIARFVTYRVTRNTECTMYIVELATNESPPISINHFVTFCITRYPIRYKLLRWH